MRRRHEVNKFDVAGSTRFDTTYLGTSAQAPSESDGDEMASTRNSLEFRASVT